MKLLTLIPKPIKRAIYFIGFPIFSILSSRVGFTVFFLRDGIWHARTRGQTFPIKEPGLWVLEYFRHFIPKSGETIFDVGGEFGYETMQFAKITGPKGKVLVFECLPDHVSHLERLKAEYPQITVVNNACWNQPCELKFHVGNTPGSNTAVADAKGQHGQSLASEQGGSLTVQADTLDNLWKKHNASQPVDFLKMDIEGAEYEALEGAKELLANTRKAVIAAYHIRDGVATAPKVAESLTAAGFHVRVDENLHVYAWR